MSEVAIVKPDDTIARIEDEADLDLSAAVKPGYRRLPVVEDLNDNSTPGNEYVTEETAPLAVEADRVLRAITRRDLTAQEVTDRKSAEIASVFNTKAERVLAKALFWLVNDVRQGRGQAAITQATFETQLRGLF